MRQEEASSPTPLRAHYSRRRQREVGGGRGTQGELSHALTEQGQQPASRRERAREGDGAGGGETMRAAERECAGVVGDRWVEQRRAKKGGGRRGAGVCAGGRQPRRPAS